MPQIVAVKFEIGKFPDGVLESVLNDRSQREFPDNRLYSFRKPFVLTSALLASSLLGRLQARPITLKYLEQGVHNVVVAHDYSELAPFIEFGLAQALAAQKCFATIAHNGSSVKPHAHQPAGIELIGGFD